MSLMMLPLFKQPTGLYVLVLATLSERLVYYGTQMMLVLYLTSIFLFSDDHSYVVYGTYIAMAYALPILGGLLADRWIGLHRAIILGLLFLVAGNVLLAVPDKNTFYIGLACVLMGVGFYKANVTSLVGKLYAPDQHEQRHEGYTLYYAGMNIGATLAPILYGIVIMTLGWRYCFILNALVIFINFLNYLQRTRSFSVTHSIKNYHKVMPQQHYIIGFVVVLLMLAVVTAVFFYPALFYVIASIALLSFAIIIVHLVKQYSLAQKLSILAVIILFLFVMMFYAISFQIGSSINLFIQEHLYRDIFGQQIPAIVFTMLYPLSVIVMVLPVTFFWKKYQSDDVKSFAITKMVIGLLSIATAFIFFSIAVYGNALWFTSYYPMGFIILGNVFLGMGEVCLVPTMYGVINRYTPINLHSTTIGLFYLSIALGGYLSGLIALWDGPIELASVGFDTAFGDSAEYLYKFIAISLATFVIAGLLLSVKPMAKRLLFDNEHH